MRLPPLDERGVDDFEPVRAVAGSACCNGSESVKLIWFRDDKLPGSCVRNAARLAIVVQKTAAFDAQCPFERAGGIVETGVYHSGVVRARLHSRTRMPLQQADGSLCVRKRACCGKSNDSSADDCHVHCDHERRYIIRKR